MTADMRSNIESLLSRLGLAATAERSTAESIVSDLLAAHGLSADVVSVRWGELVLVASAEDASSVRFLKDLLLQSVQDAGCEVTRLVVRSTPFASCE